MQNDTNIIPFGVPALDEKLRGMRRGSLTSIYAGIGGGKTSIALQIARNAVIAWHNVIFFGEAEELPQLNLKFVHLTFGMKPSYLLKQLRGLNIDLVVIDNVYLMKPDSKFENFSERYNLLFEELHAIVNKQNICLLVTNQLNRSGRIPWADIHCENVFEVTKNLLITIAKCRVAKCGITVSLEK